MRFINYKRLSPVETKELIKSKVPDLSPYQLEKLSHLDFEDLLILKPVSKEPVRPQWRMTIVLWALFMLTLVAIVMPLRWICTGRWYLQESGFIYKVIKEWGRKLNL